jgi:hypothetical protein
MYLNGKTVPFTPSPNSSARPVGTEVDLLVLHSTGDKAGQDSTDGPVSWLCNPNAKASAHFVVGRDGSVMQLVPMDRAAWHAGISSWDGRKVGRSVNAFSIGIEMEHVDGVENWPETQLQAVIALTQVIRTAYDIPLARIVGHRDVAPGRKVDPVDFPWDRYRAALQRQPAMVGLYGRVDGMLLQEKLQVPARAACEALGIVCDYLPTRRALRLNKQLVVGQLVGNVLYVPARALCEMAGLHCQWDADRDELLVTR